MPLFSLAIKNLFPLCDFFRALGGHKLVVTDSAFPVTTNFSWLFFVDRDDTTAARALWAIHLEIRQLSRESIPSLLPGFEAFFWVLLDHLTFFGATDDGDTHPHRDAWLIQR